MDANTVTGMLKNVELDEKDELLLLRCISVGYLVTREVQLSSLSHKTVFVVTTRPPGPASLAYGTKHALTL